MSYDTKEAKARRKLAKDKKRAKNRADWKTKTACKVPVRKPTKEDNVQPFEFNSQLNNGTYFIQSGDYVKIGKSGCVTRRLDALQTANPIQLNVITIEKSEINETYFHDMFKHCHVRGEWFKITPSELISALEVL